MSNLFAFPSGTNTWVPAVDEAGASLLVGYSKNVNRFAVNNYITMYPVERPVGRFPMWNSKQAARDRYDNVRDFIWADNQESPTGADNTESFSFALYDATRYRFPFTLGQISADKADFNILAAHASMAAQQAMTARTILAHDALSSGLTGAQTGTATATGGGIWSAGSTAAGYFIKNSLNNAAVAINKATIGAVEPKDLVLVIGPDLAVAMGSSLEVTDYLKSSYVALESLKGAPSVNSAFSLPDYLWGYRVIVDTTVQNVARKTGNELKYVFPSSEAYLVARPGGLEGVEGSASFSTVMAFMAEEMSVELFNDQENRRYKGYVTSQMQLQVNEISGLSGFKFTACLG